MRNLPDSPPPAEAEARLTVNRARNGAGFVPKTEDPPAPIATDEGKFYYHRPVGAPSILYFCMKNSAGILSWHVAASTP